ncbi:MAG: glycosyltransferase [Cytophagales bacterium]|nr:glycosyltransferase [Cytophagales bacterium]
MSLRILFLIPNLHQGGAQKVCIGIANTLSEKFGCKVTMFVAAKSTFFLDSISDSVALVQGNQLENKSNLEFNLQFGNQLCQLFDPNDFDCIVCGWEYAAEIALYQYYCRRILLKFNKPRLYSIIQVSLSGIKNELNWKQKYFFDLQTILRRIFIKRIITVGSGIKNEPMLRFHSNINVIHSFVDISLINEKSRIIDDKEFEKLTASPYIINVGRINKQKNHMMLIKVFSKIASKVNYNLIILGAKYDKKLTSEIEDFIVSQNIQHRVFLVDQTSNPFPWLKNAIANVSVSIYEGFPLSILESFALNVLVVSSKFNGHDDFLNEKNSLLFEINDEIMLENHLLKLSSKLEEYNSFIKNAYDLTESLTIEEVAKKYMNVFEQ